MFGALQHGDFSDGASVREQASRLGAGLPLDPSLLTNSFARPLYDLAPALKKVWIALRDAGAPHVAMTGSGPTHYAVVPTEDEANRIARSFSSLYAGDASVWVCRSCVA
jgi:4-diphosphocytidyl-2C-methyl-D-erythritol kinase